MCAIGCGHREISFFSITMGTPERIAGVLPAPIQLLSSSHLTTLWSSYGHIYRLWVRLDNSPSSKTSLILKTVNPPAVTRAADESHLRKLVSYRVERYFYANLSSALSPPNLARVATCYPVAEKASNDSLLLEDLEVNFPISPGSGLGLQRTHAVLKWLANFHAAFWGLPNDPSVTLIPPPFDVPNPSEAQGAWAQGGYWYLDTRQEEYSCIGSDWKTHLPHFQAAAEKLKTDTRGRTLIHGDCKAANILFSADSSTCALYDFQYVGGGLGAQDLVYFIGTSIDGAILRKNGAHEELLNYYYQELKTALKLRNLNADKDLFTFAVLKSQFEVALVDWMRFMAGWGRWGNAGWVESNVRSILKRWTAENSGP
ncbi:hypothetical protein M758_3G036300 [Ceratodon purpureus]|nr:hypothetical protein M758_3G036300 [Ceratodon purpureus]